MHIPKIHPKLFNNLISNLCIKITLESFISGLNNKNNLFNQEQIVDVDISDFEGNLLRSDLKNIFDLIYCNIFIADRRNISFEVSDFH